MKVYISADIEGVTGVTNFDETELHKADSKTHVEQMTAEVVAACEGAIQAGAKEIWVKDAHDTGRNIIASKLPREARLIRGWSGHPFMMLQELDKSFRAVLLIGYHSRAGAGTSPLAHTLTGRIAHIKINDRYASEFGIHTYAALSVGVPVVFVSGDKGVCDEVAAFSPDIGTVAVKEGVGNSTVNIHPALATARIHEGVKKSLAGDVARCLVPLPAHFSMEVQYKDHAKAYVHGFFPGATQKDPRTIQFDSDSYYEVMRFLLFVSF
jgi:D-amino peptidase